MARGGLKKKPGSWRIPVEDSALADRTGSKNTRRKDQNESKTSTSTKPMQTPQSVTNPNINRRGPTPSLETSNRNNIQSALRGEVNRFMTHLLPSGGLTLLCT